MDGHKRRRGMTGDETAEHNTFTRLKNPWVLRTSILTVAELTNEKSLRTTNRPWQEGQTITFVRIAAGDLSVGCYWVVRHKTTEVQCFNSKNSISILTTTTEVELKRHPFASFAHGGHRVRISCERQNYFFPFKMSQLLWFLRWIS